LDIYFENLIWMKNGKIDGKSPVRWMNSLTGEVSFGDYQSFSEKWSEFPLDLKKNIRLFVASKQLMSVRKTSQIKIFNITPIRFLGFFPKIHELIYKKTPNFFFDCSGKVLQNFNSVVNDLNIQHSELYSLGLGINWEGKALTIYPSRSLITIRYGFSDFVSFSIDVSKEKYFAKEKLNLLINSLGKFEKIKVIINNGHEKLIESALSNYKKELVTLKTDYLLPELIINKNYLDTKKTLFRLFVLSFNKLIFLMKYKSVSSFSIPVFISIIGFFMILLHDYYETSNPLKTSSHQLDYSSEGSSSLSFFDNFIKQSKSLNTKNVKSIELNVTQKPQSMVGALKIMFNSESVDDYNDLLDGISGLAKNAKFENQNTNLFLAVNYLFKKPSQLKKQSEIVFSVKQLIKNYSIGNNLSADQVRAQSENKVIITLENQQIGKINNFLHSLQKRQSGWDWVSLRFIRNSQQSTSFYGTLELLKGSN